MGQLPALTGLLLAGLLLGASAVKLHPRPGPDRSALAIMMRSPRALKRTWHGVATLEVGVAVILLMLGPRIGGWTAAVFFLAASCYVALSRKRVGERPCGCFGTQVRKVSWRSAVRPPMLVVLAVVYSLDRGIAVRALSDVWAWIWLLGCAILVFLLSDEAWFPAKSGVARKRGRSCARRTVDPVSVVDIIKQTRAWGVIAQYCKTDTPSDVWREGCWQFMSFEASINERLATAVFGVSLPPGRSICRALLRQGLVGEAVVTASDERVQWPLVEHVRGVKCFLAA